MIKEYDVIIIGAGPAGLFTAANLKYCRALIIEKNRTAGKKLLIAGSGRCNITQSGSITDFFKHYGDSNRFLLPALKEFTNINMIEYFESRGLPTIEKKGKVFPASESSYDVLNLLMRECKLNEVPIHFNEFVKSIELIEHGFSIATNLNYYHCSKLVIATGGKSYPTTGSTGDGYYFARSLGHTIETPKPALAPVYISNYNFAELSGISLKQRIVAIYRNNKKVKENRGDIGFTHWGLSGPGILDLSRYIQPDDSLRINLIDQNIELFRAAMNDRAINDKKMQINKFLKTYDLPVNLIKHILSELNLDSAFYIGNISKAQRKAVVELFCEYPFTVSRTGDFNIAMATKGGVSLDEVSSKNMESKIVKNLYFAGEVLDIDGDTGGYNIQAAFSTGYLAAKLL